MRRLSRAHRARRRAELAAHGIAWHGLRYHKRPSLPATVFDIAAGIVLGTWLVRRHGLDAVHARSHVPAVMGLAVRRLTGRRLLFDIRGLMAQEYVDIGSWAPRGLPARLTTAVERAAKWSADGAVVLTHAVVPVLWGSARPTGRPNLEVIPCCADVDAIEAGAPRRDAVRARLGLGDKTVLVYVGKFGGWYMQREMVAFFAAARIRLPDAHLLLVTQSDRELVDAEARAVGLTAGDYTVLSCPPDEMGAHLAAADAAIAFIRPLPSKVASSPTKIGEYLAAGLPTVAIAGIGDIDATLAHHRTGVLLAAPTQAEYTAGAVALHALLDDAQTPARCRQTARAELSLRDVGIPRYDALYRSLAALGRC